MTIDLFRSTPPGRGRLEAENKRMREALAEIADTQDVSGADRESVAHG